MKQQQIPAYALIAGDYILNRRNDSFIKIQKVVFTKRGHVHLHFLDETYSQLELFDSVVIAVV